MNLVLLLILGVLWGSSYMWIKVAVAEVPTLTFVAWRLTLSALVLWGLLRLRGVAMPRDRRAWKVFAALGVLNGVTPYLLISWGELYISSGLASLLTATMPIFAVLLTHSFTDERITPTKALGVALGFVGVGILMLPDLRQGVQSNLLGQAAVVVASLSYAGGAIVARSQHSRQLPLVLATGQMIIGSVITLPLSLLVDRPFGLSPSLPALASWAALTLLGTVLAYILYYHLIERTSATFISTVTYIIPVVGLLAGALALNEPLDTTLLGSLPLILMGVLLVRA